MGPDQKALLAELDKRFDVLERKLDATAASSSTRLDALESAAKVFDEWRPGVDGVIDDLRLEVTKLATLKLEVGKISKYMERSMVDGPSATSGVIAAAPVTKSASAPASPCASLRDAKAVVTPHFRSDGFGDVTGCPAPICGICSPSAQRAPRRPQEPGRCIRSGYHSDSTSRQGDEHELLLRRLFQIRQTGPVTEYINQFVALVDDLKSYTQHPDPLYYTQRFLDGLRDDIKAVLLVQRPSTLDTACVLAQLQEEALGLYKRPIRRLDNSPAYKPAWPNALALPPPPTKLADGDSKRLPQALSSSAEDKFKALRASRRAQGLCIRCGAKWSRDHKCSDMVQLHLVQELMDLFPESVAAECSEDSSPDEQIMMHLSVAAVVGSASPKTFSLSGHIQGHHLSILVDSGSSHTFLNSVLAQSLTGIKDLPSPVQVQVANGAILQCTSFLPDAHWSVQGCSFVTDLKLLPLSSYDMILGLDWLASFSPMQVHWAQKWISIPYEGATAILLGDSADLPVLQTRMVVRGSSSIPQVLVKWNNLPSALATWEDFEAVRQEYPRATAWGQAVFQGGGDVSHRSNSAQDGAPGSRPGGRRPRKPNPRVTGDQWI
ncbi:unnamed protein product [Miscanthus lutarioriparius]|uniref:Retrotransposon gag domain-containing protein n=1 Tax=Miscanthus lutarioriparius TaxID=422564 RepID=A0A811PCY0_9POAL|nr:unnamed protein product [Miscanthus lutarioriparius]